MKTTVTPAQAEEALDAISKIEVKNLNSPAGYAITKNTLSLSRVVKDFHKMRKETRAAVAPLDQHLDPASEQATALSKQWAAAAQADVPANLHRMKLSEITRNCTVRDLTTLVALDFLIEDDLPLDDKPAAE